MLTYGCSADDLRKAEKELIELSGDFEASTGDTLRLSEALAHYVLHSTALDLTEVFLEGRVLSRVASEVGAGIVQTGLRRRPTIVTKSRPY